MTILSGPSFRPMALYLLLALPLAACALPKDTMNNNPAETKKSVASENREKYRLNPNPTQRYDIVLTIAGAPGPFELMEGYAYYEAPNCTFVVDPVAGVRSHPDYGLPIQLRKLDNGLYVGTVYFDAMLDEDYFGEEKCRWDMTSIGVRLKATGAEAETRFAPSLTHAQVAAGKPVRYYFWKELYPRSKMDNFVTSGETDIGKYKADIRDNLFTITLSPKEVQQP